MMTYYNLGMKIGPRRQYETESTYPPAYAELPYSDWTKDTRGAAADLQTTARASSGPPSIASTKRTAISTSPASSSPRAALASKVGCRPVSE
jgi:hypothetical protein